MSKTTTFLDSRRLCSDDCAKEARDNQNEAIDGYMHYRHLPIDCNPPNARLPAFSYDHVNLRGRVGYGVAEDCLVDQYSTLRNTPSQLTRDRCPIQLYTRIFQGCPNLKPGVPNPDAEMPLIQGMSSGTLEGLQYPCKRAIMEMTTKHPIPMIDCMKDIQDPQHIVEPWVRGGDATRDYVRRQEFLTNCGASFERKQKM